MNRKTIVAAFQRAGVQPDDALLIACSGGLDSVVLAYIAKEMHYRLALAHVNHHTRKDASQKDERFVASLAHSLGVPFFRADFYFDAKGNFQQKARDFRYKWFDAISKKHGYHWICTAHHLDDQRETVMQKMLRGAGVQSLGGIREKRGNRLRPLLAVSKGELRKYALENAIIWREDASNDTIHYERNYVRHILLPHASSMHSRGLKGFDVTMAHFADQSLRLDQLLQWWRGKIMRELPGMLEVDLDALPPGEHRAKWLADVLLPWGQFNTKMILEKAEVGASAQTIQGKHTLATSLARVFLTQAQLPDIKFFSWSNKGVRLNGHQRFDVKVNGTQQNELDSMRIPSSFLAEAIIRQPQHGDRLKMHTGITKKLSDFLLEKRIPQPLRTRMIWLFCFNGEILWIPDLYSHPDCGKHAKETCNIAFYSPLF